MMDDTNGCIALLSLDRGMPPDTASSRSNKAQHSTRRASYECEEQKGSICLDHPAAPGQLVSTTVFLRQNSASLLVAPAGDKLIRRLDVRAGYPLESDCKSL